MTFLPWLFQDSKTGEMSVLKSKGALHHLVFVLASTLSPRSGKADSLFVRLQGLALDRRQLKLSEGANDTSHRNAGDVDHPQRSDSLTYPRKFAFSWAVENSAKFS